MCAFLIDKYKCEIKISLEVNKFMHQHIMVDSIGKVETSYIWRGKYISLKMLLRFIVETITPPEFQMYSNTSTN